MKHIRKRVISLFLSLVIICSFATPALAAKSYDANAALAYAKNHWNDGKGLCAEFVSDCLKAGGCTVWNRGCTSMVRELKNSGYGTWYQLTLEKDGRISVPKNSALLSIGDPVFFYCPKETDGCPYVHVVLYSGQDSNGFLKCYAHNNPKNNEVAIAKWCGYCKANNISAAYVYHMNGSVSSPSTPSTPQYFNCNVKIDCVNGKTVNLYNAPGNSSKVDYFSKGQSVTSNYGAKLNDGSTWYRITVSSNGSVRNLWLKYESNKMTVKDLTSSAPTPQAKPVTIKFNTSSLAFDLSKNSGQTVTLTIGGDLPANCGLQPSMSKSGIAEVDWGNTTIGLVSNPVITAKAAGETTLTCAVINKDTQATLAKAELKIKVTAPTYAIKYDANGGQNAPASQTKEHQKTFTLSGGQPTRDGYSFMGWATSANGSAQYQPGGQYTANQNVTLYAVWSANSYTVRYDANGGSGAPTAQTKAHQKALTLSSGQPTRDGYSFMGWATSANGSAQYQPGGQYTANQNVTLYAVWSANSYTVRYDANGGSGAPTAQTKAHQKVLTLSSGQPTRDGYSFIGWATSANGSAQYQPGGQYTANQNLTLYAVWSLQNSVTLTLANSMFDIEAYEQFTLSFSYTGDVEKVTYDVENESICVFDYTDSTSKQNGKTNISMVFKARSAGSTSISINLLDGKGNVISSKKASVTVVERTAPPVLTGGYESNLGLSSLEVGESHVFWIKGTYSDGTVRDVTDLCKVSSSDTNILAVNGHTVSAKNVGTAQILVTYPEGLTLPKTISVVAAPEEKEPLWISFDQPEYTCYVDVPADEYHSTPFTLRYSTNASDATYRWSVSDLSLIYMAWSNRFTSTTSPEISLRHNKVGDATLYVTITQDGQTATASCKIHVRERQDRQNVIDMRISEWMDYYGIYPHLQVSFRYHPMHYSIIVSSLNTGETVWQTESSHWLGLSGVNRTYGDDWDLSSLPSGEYRATATATNSFGTVTTEVFDFTL